MDDLRIEMTLGGIELVNSKERLAKNREEHRARVNKRRAVIEALPMEKRRDYYRLVTKAGGIDKRSAAKREVRDPTTATRGYRGTASSAQVGDSTSNEQEANSSYWLAG